MSRILENDYTFVTNNRSDFLDLHGREAQLDILPLSADALLTSSPTAWYILQCGIHRNRKHLLAGSIS
jgi:hypothetical protein